MAVCKLLRFVVTVTVGRVRETRSHPLSYPLPTTAVLLAGLFRPGPRDSLASFVRPITYDCCFARRFISAGSKRLARILCHTHYLRLLLCSKVYFGRVRETRSHPLSYPLPTTAVLLAGLFTNIDGGIVQHRSRGVSVKIPLAKHLHQSLCFLSCLSNSVIT
jgi:hypothetical protein